MVLITLVVAVTVAVVVLVTQPHEYRASAQVRVEVGLPADASAEALEAAKGFSDFQTVTFKALVITDPVMTDVIRSEDLDLTPAELATHVEPIAAAETSIIEIRVTWGDAKGAADIANAVAQRLVEESPEADGDVEVTLSQVKQAQPSAVAVTPNAPLAIGLAVFAAVLLSAVWLFLRRLRRAPSAYTES